MKNRLRFFTVMAILCFSFLLPNKVYAAEIIHSGMSGDIKWSIDSDGVFILEGDGELGCAGTFGMITDTDGSVLSIPNIDRPWLEYADKIKHGKVRVKNVTNLAGIFYECVNLETVDFTGSDTSKVKNFGGMFVPSYASETVTNKLKNVDLSMLDTSSARSLSQMFMGCENLETVNLTGWNTSNVTSVSAMFNYCESLKKIEGLSTWDTSNVRDFSLMFQNCKNLEELNIGGWSTKNLLYLHGMFAKCQKIKKIDISYWDVSRVTNFGSLFEGCWNLQKMDLSNWDMSQAKDITRMFKNCHAISGGVTLSSDLDYAGVQETFMSTNIKSNEPFIIRYSGKITKERAKALFAISGNKSKNLYLVGEKDSVVSLVPATQVYTGEPVEIGNATVIGSKGNVYYTYYTDSECKKKTTKKGSGSSGAGKAPVNAGTYYVTATVNADGKYNAATSKAVELVIEKAKAQITVKTTEKTYKYGKVKKKKQSFSLKTKVTSGGKIKYKKMSGSKYLSVNKEGKVVVKKGTKKGTYKIKIKITVPATKNYKGINKTVNVKVKVK